MAEQPRVELPKFPTCKYAGRERPLNRFCRNPQIGNGGVVSPAKCWGCEFAGTVGTAEPITISAHGGSCGSCAKREKWLDSKVPGLGKAVAWAIKVTRAEKLAHALGWKP